MHPAVFLDRDGVLNENRADYVKSWAEFAWLPGARAALAALSRLGVPILVVTNQSMVGRGRVPPTDLEHIHTRMLEDVADSGGRIDGVLVCTHAPSDGCGCRKPAPGLLIRASHERSIDLSRSVLVGDALTDFQAATAAGARYVHVLSGRGRTQLPLPANIPVVADLAAAVPVCAELLKAGVSV